jgi:hypothetical protein
MAAVASGKTAQIVYYFGSEGRQNLTEVLLVIRKTLRKRQDLQSLKLVIFTAEGQGPALAFNRLREFKTEMIAVTFPIHFSVPLPDGKGRYFPKISEDIRQFFDGVRIKVLVPPRLPFDVIDGMDGHNQQVELIRKTIAMFGSGFALCVQAVLHACDVGAVQEDEAVIAMSGDTAALIIASTTAHFLNRANGLQIQEIFCKPRTLTISRRRPMPAGAAPALEAEGRVLEGEVSPQP